MAKKLSSELYSSNLLITVTFSSYFTLTGHGIRVSLLNIFFLLTPTGHGVGVAVEAQAVGETHGERARLLPQDARLGNG